MKALALCLLAGALVIAGCGSSGSASHATAPRTQTAASSGSAGQQQAGVAAVAAKSPGQLCAAEGRGKPKKQCVGALGRIARGTVKNPAAACKGLSRKKTKGVRGKSPRAVCVRAAALLMAAKAPNPANGSAAGTPSSADTGTTDTSTDSADSSGDSSGLTCEDADGNPVPPDDPSVEDCTDNSDTTATDSSSADDGSDTSGDTSTDDTSTDASP